MEIDKLWGTETDIQPLYLSDLNKVLSALDIRMLLNSYNIAIMIKSSINVCFALFCLLLTRITKSNGFDRYRGCWLILDYSLNFNRICIPIDQFQALVQESYGLHQIKLTPFEKRLTISSFINDQG